MGDNCWSTAHASSYDAQIGPVCQSFSILSHFTNLATEMELSGSKKKTLPIFFWSELISERISASVSELETNSDADSDADAEFADDEATKATCRQNMWSSWERKRERERVEWALRLLKNGCESACDVRERKIKRKRDKNWKMGQRERVTRWENARDCEREVEWVRVCHVCVCVCVCVCVRVCHVCHVCVCASTIKRERARIFAWERA